LLLLINGVYVTGLVMEPGDLKSELVNASTKLLT
jgi:hypothetical protein